MVISWPSYNQILVVENIFVFKLHFINILIITFYWFHIFSDQLSLKDELFSIYKYKVQIVNIEFTHGFLLLKCPKTGPEIPLKYFLSQCGKNTSL